MILISVVSTHENGDVPEGQSVVYVLFGKKSILDPENLEREGGGESGILRYCTRSLLGYSIVDGGWASSVSY